MLIMCPECELQVSDQAVMCPHCGYPMKKEKIVRRSTKRKRLPNGFGQISEIKGKNLRKPFRVMITVAKNEHGRPICKPLKPNSYFETYNDAYAALVEYNKKPYELDNIITLTELYNRWSPIYYSKLREAGTIRAMKNAWKYCSSVYTMRVTDLRPRHIKYCMENGEATLKGEKKTPTPLVKYKIKSLFNLMLDYALEYELVEKNVARSFKLSSDIMNEIYVKKGHIPYTEDEMSKLWNHPDDPIVNIILIQCYSGWRPQEICKLKKADINLEDRTMKGGMKTKAGTDRLIPIHSKVFDLIKKQYDEAKGEYLFDISYNTLYEKYAVLVEKLGLDTSHRPHDGRVHFVTEAKKHGVDEYAIKYIVGHVINDITEKTYTKREFDWLRCEIEKIR